MEQDFLNHKFILLDKSKWSYREYMEVLDAKKSLFFLALDENIIKFISPTLNFISTINPANGDEINFGLNTFGITIIDKIGASKAEKIISAWIDIFLQAENEIQFQGEPIYLDDKLVDSGIIKFNKKEVLSKFRLLRRYFNIILNDDNYYLLHLGL